jgi:hypothetical protein
MNAIPLINNAPRPNINVGSIGSPAFNPVAAGAKLGGSIGGNVMRQNPASMPVNNEAQLRQEVNTSIVALKREAFSLENLIAQAAQTLQDINKRLSELEGKQGDYVKKNDVVDSITSGNMNPVTSNAVATSNAMPVNSVTSGNLHSVTSGAVYNALSETKTFTVSLVGWANDAGNTPYTIKSITATGYKIADKTYVIPVEMYPQNSDPAPSTIIHLIEVANIERVLLVGGLYTRSLGYEVGCKPQISGTRYYLRRVDNGLNWLPSSWGTGTNTLIQGSVIVRIN